VRILATDLSTKVLARARTGVYDLRRTDGLEAAGLRRWFVRVSSPADEKWQVRPEVRSMVSFARLNLMDRWPMQGPFDAILCRNVMIYFDKETQERLVSRFASLLAPGGYLLIGHSESLSGIEHMFDYVQPAVYVR
jgi:chemotaxis protein methyltransferase CheR